MVRLTDCSVVGPGVEQCDGGYRPPCYRHGGLEPAGAALQTLMTRADAQRAAAAECRQAALSTSSLAAGAHSPHRRSCPRWSVSEAPRAAWPAGAAPRPLTGPTRWRRGPQSSAQRGDPFDMQSVAPRGSEAEEGCHSGAWRRDTRNVRHAGTRVAPRPPASEASKGRRATRSGVNL